MTAMKKYAVIWCSDASGDLELQEKMISAFGRENEEWEIIQPVENDFLEKAFDYSGHVISGSPKSVIDDARTPLVSNLLAFLRGAAQRGEGPVVGLCFGAQAIAAALGGQVGRNPSGRFKLGVDRLEWSNEAQVLFGPQVGAGPTVLVQSHGECVTTLPPGGVQLASSQTIPHEVFLVNGQFLGIQGHPEVDRQFLQQKFMAYHRALFDDDEWVRVQQESQQALDPERVIALGRRLLDAGRLPATPQDISALPA
ncbi:type 1 glutamine amidotransferase [Cupriavidus campinensis]|uniref:type 1 glutamine amidotransferase n=1 Tax=Cupriavidus campinensis TaxID=151783 RepID=UPI0024E26C8F|nr:type 1 glutamine amidotransferase [Cupriavidus campinensis]